MVFSRSASRTGFLAALLVLAVATVTRADGPAPARLVPAEGLVAYLEYDGLDAHEGAWRGTAAHAMIHGTPAGSMVADVARQSVDRLLKGAPAPRSRVPTSSPSTTTSSGTASSWRPTTATRPRSSSAASAGRRPARGSTPPCGSALGADEFAALKPTKVRGRDVYRSEHRPAPVPAIPGQVQDAAPVPAPNVLPPQRRPPRPRPPSPRLRCHQRRLFPRRPHRSRPLGPSRRWSPRRPGRKSSRSRPWRSRRRSTRGGSRGTT